MAHARTTLRADIVAALIAAATPAGSRVFTEERVAKLTEAELPAIRVLVQSESQERTTLLSGRANAYIDRHATVLVTYETAQSAGFISAADGALALIEIAMATITSTVIKDTRPQQVLFDIDDSGALPFFSAAQQFDVSYTTTQADPATAF